METITTQGTTPAKFKHTDLRIGMELPYRDPRNAGWFGVIMNIYPRIPGYPGRGWTRYNIRQRGPHGLSPYGVERTIGELNREFTLPLAPATPAAPAAEGASR